VGAHHGRLGDRGQPDREGRGAGNRPKDIQISLQQDLLTIKGEKREKHDEQDEYNHQVDRTHGMFARSVRLPVTVDGSKVAASFKNGLLTVTLTKTDVQGDDHPDRSRVSGGGRLSARPP
jgi:HSP20 family molecular chaperone IbpA